MQMLKSSTLSRFSVTELSCHSREHSPVKSVVLLKKYFLLFFFVLLLFLLLHALLVSHRARLCLVTLVSASCRITAGQLS